MRSEKDIKKKRDKLQELMEDKDLSEEIILSTIGRAKIRKTVNVLTWVLDEGSHNDHADD